VSGSSISQSNQENECQLGRSSGAGALLVVSLISQSNQSYLQTLEPGAHAWLLEAWVEHLMSTTILSLMAVMVTPGMLKTTEKPWAIQAGRCRHRSSLTGAKEVIDDASFRTLPWLWVCSALVSRHGQRRGLCGGDEDGGT
jgi:hypothetical protein